jgi:hypothetical protein
MSVIKVRRIALLVLAASGLAVGALAVRSAAADPPPSRTIAVGMAPEANPLPPYTSQYLNVDVVTTSGVDCTVDTAVTLAVGGGLVTASKITAADPLTVDDSQHLGVSIAGYASGTVFTITSTFKDATGNVVDTQSVNWTKP